MLAKLIARLCAPPVASCIRREELCLAFVALSKLYPTLPPPSTSSSPPQHNKLLEPCKNTNLQEEKAKPTTPSFSSPLAASHTTASTNTHVSNVSGDTIKSMPFTVQSLALVERVRHLLPVCSSREISLIATGLAALSLATPPIMDVLIRHLYILCENERSVCMSGNKNKEDNYNKVKDDNCNLATLTTMINVALSTGHVYSCTLAHLIREHAIRCVKSSTRESRSTILRFVNAAANYLESEKEITVLIESFAEATKMSVNTLREAVTRSNKKKSKHVPLCVDNTELTHRQEFAQLLTECQEESENSRCNDNLQEPKSLSTTYYERVLRLMEMYTSHNLNDPCALSMLESLCMSVFLRPATESLHQTEEEEEQKQEEKKQTEQITQKVDEEINAKSTSKENIDVIQMRRQLWEMVNKHSGVFHRLRHTLLLQRSSKYKANTSNNELQSNECHHDNNSLPHLEHETLTEEELTGSSTSNTMQPMQLIHRAYEDMCHGVNVQEATLTAIHREYREYDSVEAMTKAAALFAELGKVPDGLVYKLYGHLHELTLRGVSALLRAVRRDMTCSLTTAVQEMLRDHVHAELICQSKLSDIVELLDVLAMPLPRAFQLPEGIINGEAQLRSLLHSHILNIASEMHLPSLVYLTTHACAIEDKPNNSNDLDVLLTLTCNKLSVYLSNNNKSTLHANSSSVRLKELSSSSSSSKSSQLANREEIKMSYVILTSLYMLAKRDRVHDELLDCIASFATARLTVIESKYTARSSSQENTVKVNELEQQEQEELLLLEKFFLLAASLQITLDAWQLHEPMERVLHLIETYLQNTPQTTSSQERRMSTSLLLTAGLLAAQGKRVMLLHRIQSELESDARVESMTQEELKFTIALLLKCEIFHPSLIQQVLHKIWQDTEIHAQLHFAPADHPSTFVKHAELNKFTSRQNFCDSSSNRGDLCLEQQEEFKRIVHEELCVLNAADVGSLLATCTRCFVPENDTYFNVSKESENSSEPNFDTTKESSFDLSREDIQIMQKMQTYLQSRLRACHVRTYITLCVQSYRCEHFLTLPFTDSLLTYFPRALDYLTSSQISEALFAFGEMTNAGQRLPHEVATAGSVDYVVDNVDLFWSGPEIAKLLHGFAKLHCTKRSLYSVFAKHLGRRAILFTLDRPSISLIFHAFGLVKFVDKELMDRLTFVCKSHAGELNPADLLLIVKSYSRMMLWSPGFYRVMGAQITARASEFPVLALCELFTAFGSIQLHDNDLAEQLLETIAERVHEIPEANTAVEVLVSMWQMSAGILGNTNASTIADYIVSHAQQLNSTSLLKLCTVMNDISWSNKELLKAMADQSVKLKLEEQITPEAGRAVLDVLSQNLMHHEAARNELSKLARGVTKETVLLSDNEVQELQALIARESS